MDDYLTLRSVDANYKGADGILTWYIPDNYYTNNRGSICDFEICLYNVCCNPADLPGTEYFTVETDLPSYNNSDTTNDNWSVCGIITNTGTTQRIGDLPIYRTTAKPNKISILIRRANDQRLDWTSSDNSGIFVFRFMYSNPEEETKDYINTFYKTL